MGITILSGHTSPETAYVVADYPYGFRLRCQIRYWLDCHPKRGVRFMVQTSNPKAPGLVWNKPKASIYSKFGACMFLDEAGHVQHTGMHEYMDAAAVVTWVETFGAGVPPTFAPIAQGWMRAKVAYEAKRAVPVATINAQGASAD